MFQVNEKMVLKVPETFNALLGLGGFAVMMNGANFFISLLGKAKIPRETQERNVNEILVLKKELQFAVVIPYIH